MGSRANIIIEDRETKNSVVLYVSTTKYDVEAIVKRVAKNAYGETDIIKTLLSYGETNGTFSFNLKFSDRFTIDLNPFGDYDTLLRVAILYSKDKEKGFVVDRFDTLEEMRIYDLVNSDLVDYVATNADGIEMIVVSEQYMKDINRYLRIHKIKSLKDRFVLQDAVNTCSSCGVLCFIEDLVSTEDSYMDDIVCEKCNDESPEQEKEAESDGFSL